jgi:hypothetical protein
MLKVKGGHQGQPNSTGNAQDQPNQLPDDDWGDPNQPKAGGANGPM